ncbi:putative S-adenosylmethionine-dependent methyltransferase/MSMEI_2290 [Mycobacterium pseudokansasii]|nr:SAM-dependent methyltransferase [Mycobacterium kansasii]VAZ98362.1 putative S-adenosylmethionine-dependent methyltransferase/MSMEI_2290 [Mycobacterium pseudokansasii]VAZ99863.1 putative S-adenosylmethionine-dependent methyltransferase/MSMEI_2290 [Mycobacterium pseudokansasii]
MGSTLAGLHNVADYWNHNTAYHPWLVDIAARHHGDVLDVGCGEGLLMQRLAAVSRRVVGIDPDAAAVERARLRLHSMTNTSVDHCDFQGFTAPEQSFDVVAFVASIHHQPLREALAKTRRLLRPGGELAVVGLAANKTISDWAWSLLCMPIVRIGSRVHGETRDIGVPVTEPQENLGQIRQVANEVLPNAEVRRGLYYRYLLHWRDPR